MKNILKIGALSGLLVTVLLLSASCLATATPAGSGNATGTAAEQSTFDSIWPMLIIMVVFFAFIYFMMIRPQRKRQKEQQTMMQGLQKGDRVITAGGIYGTIESVREDSVIIKVESGTTMRVNKGSVGLRRDDTAK
jgi:preprotein translocase subunit YajC